MNEEELRELVEKGFFVAGDRVRFKWDGGEVRGEITTEPSPGLLVDERYYLSFNEYAERHPEQLKVSNVLVDDVSLSELKADEQRFQDFIQKKKQKGSKNFEEVERKLQQIEESDLEPQIEKLLSLKTKLEREIHSLRQNAQNQKESDESGQKKRFLEEVETKLGNIKQLAQKSDKAQPKQSPNLLHFRQHAGSEIQKMKDKIQKAIEGLNADIEVLNTNLANKAEELKHKMKEEPDHSEEEDPIGKELAALYQKIKSLPLPEGHVSKAEKDVADRREVERLKRTLNSLLEEKKKLEDEIKEQKAAAAASTPTTERRRTSYEIESLKRLIAEEEQERKQLQAQLKDLKETLSKLEEAQEGRVDEGGAGDTRKVALETEGGFFKEKSLEINWHDIKIVKRIGGGGFAEVFEGILHGERVAVKKLISQSWDQEGRKELEKEVEIMCNSHSAYIVSLYGFSLYPPNMCMVMEFFPRGSLAYILWDKNIPLNWNKKWAFAKDCALALNYLHSRNPPILHRDIKAGNYLVDSDWRLKLTDFGCSIFKGTEEKKEGTEKGEKENFIGGTFQWTAPEVLSGEPYTEKADVYSFAMVLFEIASRKQPWDEYSSPDEQYRVRTWVGEGKRPNFPVDTPQDFRSLAQQAWEHDIIKRASMPSILRIFERKGMLTDDVQGQAESPFEEKARLKDEIEQKKQEKEALEARTGEAEKQTEKEKRQRMDLEQKSVELEAKLELERNNLKAVERQKDEAERRMVAERTKATEALKKLEDMEKKYKKEKQIGDRNQRTKDEFTETLDELTKKWEGEKKKRMELQKELLQTTGGSST